ncbi:MAG: GNAT family N-acetyltransferase [Verrucomicrobiales bacterium]|nr:GNAT family N-acetyltransferase [Verrucomicrobiales bacterium]
MGDRLPPGFVLREAEDADGAAVRALVFGILAEYGLRPEPDGIDRDLSAPRTSYVGSGGWFAVLTVRESRSADRIVGSVGLLPEEDGVVELRKMYLASECRGRGLGSSLLARAMEEARRRGFRRIRLSTARVLREAVALYERRGFRPVDKTSPACRCDLVMELTLEPGSGSDSGSGSEVRA